MTLQTAVGHTPRGEDSDDLREWLRLQAGCPTIAMTTLLSCANPVHGTEHPSWFFVEADAEAGVARRRCVGCAVEHSLLDSAGRWTFPPMWACHSCSQSMAELAAGLHTQAARDGRPDEEVSWVALAARCVGCGRIAGLTDFVVAPAPVEEIAAQL